MTENDISRKLDKIIDERLEYISCYANGEDMTQAIEQVQDLVNIRHSLNNKKTIDAKDKNIDRGIDIMKTVLECGSKILVVTIPLAVYAKMFEQGMEFEKTGTFVSKMVNNHMRLFNPFKK